MNILTRFTAKAMKKTPGRTLVTILGVILSAAMFTAVTTFAFSLWTFLKDGAIAQTGDYFVSCNFLSEEEVRTLKDDRRITHMAQYKALGYLETQKGVSGPLSTFVLAAGDPAYFEAMPIRLSQGRYPENSGELLLHEGALWTLETYGIETAVGSRISPELLRCTGDYPEVGSLGELPLSFTGEYTVVGHIREDVSLSNNGRDTYPMLTLADGKEGTPLWYRVYLKSNPNKVWDLIKGSEFHDIEVNETLLAIYGQSRYENFTEIILWLAIVLCTIIVVGSVSLIYNSFSISLSERTKQFGLLSCIGATKKQLRRAVYAEAMFLALPGIPLGVFFGYSGISLTLYFLRSRIALILGGSGEGIVLHGVFSPLALTLGGLLALVTLLLSASIPAKRATAISPLESIRQSRDYVLPKKRKKLRPSLFGMPGTLAKSYYRVSKGKYRATLISLIVSLVVFLAAAGFTTGLKQTADEAINVESYDFSCFVSPEEGNTLSEQDFVSASAYLTDGYFLAQIHDDQRSEEFLRYRDDLQKAYPQAVAPVAGILVCYLEDSVLEDYLMQQGLDPQSYLDPQNPKALVVYKKVTTYFMADERGIYNRFTYHYPPLSSEVSELVLFPDGAPETLFPFGSDIGHTYDYTTDKDGNLILTLIPYGTNEYGHVTEDTSRSLSYAVKWIRESDGTCSAAYYLIDKETGIPSHTPVCQENTDLTTVSIGETVETLPFGVSQKAIDTPYYVSLILPLSAAPRETKEQGFLSFSASDYPQAKAYLKSEIGEGLYVDYRNAEESARAMILVVDIFSYGFIVLICLICIANIFNTLSTNVALRKRDFGMLRSIGFRERDLWKMLCYECLTYGTKALLWGLPLGLIANMGIQKFAADIATISYAFPLSATASAVISVFIIVFATMFYAGSKLRKDNPIEAIRQECI